jgi:hypothetical protein
MTVVRADTMPKVGYRPPQTDPFAAAHLSGLGKYEFGRPFDPWELYSDTRTGLHGLGDAYSTILAQIDASQNVAASPDGTVVQDLDTGNVIDISTGIITEADGTVLKPPTAAAAAAPVSASAPATGVPAGTVLQYSVSWAPVTLTSQTPADIEAKVAAALKSKWGISVTSSNATSSVLVNTPTFTIQVQTQTDYGAANDIKAIIDGEVNAAGRKVTSSQIAIIKQSPNTTAQMLNALSAAQAAGDTVTAQKLSEAIAAANAQPSSVASIATWLENNALYIGTGLAALIVLPRLSKKLF